MLLMKYFIDVGDELFKANNNCLWLFYNVIVLLHTLLKFEIAFEMKWFRFAETLQCHGYAFLRSPDSPLWSVISHAVVRVLL